jgi:energy-coupling factor transporter ATP-binding protein EcfA2
MLKRLEICALRGATRRFGLDFEAGKKFTIIYGANGAGKSTICDAIELLATGKIGSLEGKGLGKTDAYWLSTGCRAGDTAVMLASTRGQWSAKVARGRVTVVPAEGRPQAAVLRRSQILGLIAQQPRHRFDAIRPFLDIDAVEKSEAALKQLIDQETANERTALARIEESRVAVENFWLEAGKPGREAVTWARAELRKDNSGLQAEYAALQDWIGRVERLVAEERRFAECQAEASAASGDLRTADAQVAQEQKRAAQQAGDLVALLQAADAYFQAHEHGAACPLCGSTERALGLSDRVRQQLQGITALTDALARRNKAAQWALVAEAVQDKQRLALTSAAHALAAAVQSGALLPVVEAQSALLAAAQSYRACAESERPGWARSLAAEAGLCLDLLRAEGDLRQKRLLLAETLRRAVETHDENVRTQAELAFLLPRFKHTLTIMQAERHRFVDNVLTRVADRVGELYEAIHPGEGLSRISLALDPAKRASLEILGRFPAASAAPPGAYFSESHLDTLGLCIWLALAEMNDPANTILVLDDVIAGVDEPHADRVLDLLYDLAQNFQHCIFTTHHGPWREKVWQGWQHNGQCQFVDLKAWSHSAGIQQGRSAPSIEEPRGGGRVYPMP